MLRLLLGKSITCVLFVLEIVFADLLAEVSSGLDSDGKGVNMALRSIRLSRWSRWEVWDRNCKIRAEVKNSIQ